MHGVVIRNRTLQIDCLYTEKIKIQDVTVGSIIIKNRILNEIQLNTLIPYIIIKINTSHNMKNITKHKKLLRRWSFDKTLNKDLL